MIKQITKDQAIKIAKDRELFDRISDDSVSYEDFSMPDHLYLGVYKDSALVGFFWLHAENSKTWVVHCNILKESRDISLLAAKEFYRFIIDELSDVIHKLICKIPVTYIDVYKFTKKTGFIDEGIDRESIIKNGNILDRYMLGITMTEIKKWVD